MGFRVGVVYSVRGVREPKKRASCLELKNASLHLMAQHGRFLKFVFGTWIKWLSGGGGTLNGLGFWFFSGRCPSKGHSKTGEHVENGSSHFHVPPPLKHGRWEYSIVHHPSE